MTDLSRIILAIAITSMIAIVGCGNKDSGKSGTAPSVPTTTTEPADPAPPTVTPPPTPTGVVLVGAIIKKPWSKSMESWNAGGSEYYVLDVGDAKVERKTAKEGVTLLASDSVSMADFAASVGKRVSVRGEYVDAKPYTPESPTEQYPTGINGKPAPRGAGFRVLAISPTK